MATYMANLNEAEVEFNPLCGTTIDVEECNITIFPMEWQHNAVVLQLVVMPTEAAQQDIDWRAITAFLSNGKLQIDNVLEFGLAEFCLPYSEEDAMKEKTFVLSFEQSQRVHQLNISAGYMP